MSRRAQAKQVKAPKTIPKIAITQVRSMMNRLLYEYETGSSTAKDMWDRARVAYIYAKALALLASLDPDYKYRVATILSQNGISLSTMKPVFMDTMGKDCYYIELRLEPGSFNFGEAIDNCIGSPRSLKCKVEKTFWCSMLFLMLVATMEERAAAVESTGLTMDTGA